MPSIGSTPQDIKIPAQVPKPAAETSAAGAPAASSAPAAADSTSSAHAHPPLQDSAADIMLLGKAQPTLSLSDGDDPAIQAWKQAAKGPRLELKAKEGSYGHIGALAEHAKGLSDAQHSCISSFIKDFPAEYGAKDKSGQARAYKLLDELLEAGISKEQCGLIASGKFTAADMVRLLRENPNPSLVGWNPDGIRNDGIQPANRFMQDFRYGGAVPVMMPFNNDSSKVSLPSAPPPKLPESPKTPNPRDVKSRSPEG